MLLWIDGFDAYGTSGAPSPAGVLARKYTTVTYESSFHIHDGRVAGYCLEFNSSSQYFTSPPLTTNATMIVGLAFKTPSWPGSGHLISFLDGTTKGMNVRMTVGGELAVYLGNSLIATTSGCGLTLNNWYYIEFKVVCGASGSYDLRVSGLSVLANGSINTKAGTNNYHTAFRVGEESVIQIYFSVDDLYCADGATGAVTNFLGNQKVITIYPDGDVVGYTDFIRYPSGDHYTCVDENPVNDTTDYVTSWLIVVEETVKGASPSTNEVQTITLTGATDGTFRLTFGANTTAPLAYNISAADLQTALEGLTSIGAGNVGVAGDAGGPYTVTFQGALAATDVAMLVASQTDLWNYGAVSGLGVIAGIQINTQARETDATTFTLITVIKSDDTVDPDAGQVIGSTNYKSLRRVSETDPDAAPGTAWTAGTLSAAQFGVKVG